jgi:hypothetical protein
MGFHIAVSLLDPLTTGGCYLEVTVTSGTISSSFQPTLTMDPKPIFTKSSSSSAQSTTQSISGAKSDQVTMIVVDDFNSHCDWCWHFFLEAEQTARTGNDSH